MNVHYLILGQYFANDMIGVGGKIIAKLNALRTAGLNLEATVFAAQPPEMEVPDFITFKQSPAKEKDYYPALKQLTDSLKLSNRYILLRYQFASEDWLRFVSTYPATFIFEHNTFEEVEATMLQKQHLARIPFSFSPSYLHYFFRTRVLNQTGESQYGPAVLKLAKAGMAVTPEIAAYEKSRYKNYQCPFISNGVDVSNFKILPAPSFQTTLNCFMLIGTDAAWHGVDRIIKGLAAYQGKAQINVTFFGLKDVAADLNTLPANCRVILKDKFPPAQLHKELEGMHLSFSTLALHRKKMKQAASLKLRESMLYGFPVVLGYYDVDVSGNDAFRDFLLQVPANEQPLDFIRVLDFFTRVSVLPAYRQNIHNLAVNTFGYEVKAAQIKDFLYSLDN